MQTHREYKGNRRKNKDVEVSIEDVAHVIEVWTGIPVQRLTEIETEKL